MPIKSSTTICASLHQTSHPVHVERASSRPILNIMDPRALSRHRIENDVAKWTRWLFRTEKEIMHTSAVGATVNRRCYVIIKTMHCCLWHFRRSPKMVTQPKNRVIRAYVAHVRRFWKKENVFHFDASDDGRFLSFNWTRFTINPTCNRNQLQTVLGTTWHSKHGRLLKFKA